MQNDVPEVFDITPLPWTIDRETFDIVGPEDAVIGRIYTRCDFPCADPDEVELWDRAGVEFEANADYVETAVNGYPKLVAAISKAHGILVDKWGHADAEYQPTILQVIAILSDALIEAGHHD